MLGEQVSEMCSAANCKHRTMIIYCCSIKTRIAGYNKIFHCLRIQLTMPGIQIFIGWKIITFRIQNQINENAVQHMHSVQ